MLKFSQLLQKKLRKPGQAMLAKCALMEEGQSIGLLTGFAFVAT